MTLIRSTALLLVSPPAMLRFMKAIRYEQNYYLFATITLVFRLKLLDGLSPALCCYVRSEPWPIGSVVAAPVCDQILIAVAESQSRKNSKGRTGRSAWRHAQRLSADFLLRPLHSLRSRRIARPVMVFQSSCSIRYARSRCRESFCECSVPGQKRKPARKSVSGGLEGFEGCFQTPSLARAAPAFGLLLRASNTPG